MSAISYFLVIVTAAVLSAQQRSFTIDWDNDTFVKDGQPFQIISGEIHYFRLPHQYWRDRLQKMKAAGLNTICTYVEWSQHEKKPDEYSFKDDTDLVDFINIAQEEGLLVLLRPGPYICAERDLGGYPSWLLGKYPDIELRTMDSRHTAETEKWMAVLMEKMKPLLYGNGGPIIAVQVENEYDFSGKDCSAEYKNWHRDLLLKYVETAAILFTNSGTSESSVVCAHMDGVLGTLDFGPGFDSLTESFANLRKIQPNGPLMNAEFYPGWVTHWGENLASRPKEQVASSLDELLASGASVSMYMFYGGTNFGFTAGANEPYISDITSYDYDAPLTEAGDPTEKYFLLRDVILKYNGDSNNVTIAPSEKGDYGSLTLKPTASLFHPEVRNSLGQVYQSQDPKSFEELGQNFGYLLYETTIPKTTNLPLHIDEVHDRGLIYVDGAYIGEMSREFKTNEININTENEANLGILTTNLGRINIGKIEDFKGILSNVLLNNNEVKNFSMTSFEFDSLENIENCLDTKNCIDLNNPASKGPIFYMTKFNIDKPLDTFLDLTNFTKGFVFVNNFNLGRYWTERGPQLGLYIPGVVLKQGENTMIVFDETFQMENVEVKFSNVPLFK